MDENSQKTSSNFKPRYQNALLINQYPSHLIRIENHPKRNRSSGCQKVTLEGRFALVFCSRGRTPQAQVERTLEGVQIFE